jgi:hypothetical protein
MFQSQPYIAIIGLLYGALTGAIITKTVIEDNYNEQRVIEVLMIEESIVTATSTTIPTITSTTTSTTTSTLPMALVSDSVSNEIPKDKTKRCPEWESKFVEYGLPPKLFSYIAWRESGCNPKAHNTKYNKDGSQDLGLLQINSTWKTVTRNICDTSINGLFNIDCNLKVAKYLYENGGAAHWSL